MLVGSINACGAQSPTVWRDTYMEHMATKPQPHLGMERKQKRRKMKEILKREVSLADVVADLQ